MINSHHRVNYDLIAHLYDEPNRDYAVDSNLVDFLRVRTNHFSSQIRILDMGCGTGKQLTANRSEFPELEMIGVDLFHGMLKRAQNRGRYIKWVQSDNVNPPFARHSFDYITNQFSYHHVKDKSGLIASIFRILKPGGRFVITNLDPWSMQEWIVYACFPAARQRDLQDFLPVEELTTLMEKTGFGDICVRYQHSSSEEKLNDFLEYASQRHRTSQLMAIQDDEYEAGIARLKENIAKLGHDAFISSELCLVWITGDKPG